MRRILVAAACLSACGPSGPGIPPDSPDVQLLRIVNYTWTPRRIAVVPGGAVVVRNEDTLAHSVTSAPSAGAHQPGAVNGIRLDTGAFVGDRALTVPADAPIGTIVPCFCFLHPGAAGDDGEVEVVAPLPTSP